jgi:hypothetical protein
MDVAVHFSQNHHFTGTDHLPLRPTVTQLLGKLHYAPNLAVNVGRLGTCYFALDLQILVNRCRISGCRGLPGGPGWFCSLMVDRIVSIFSVYLILYPLDAPILYRY